MSEDVRDESDQSSTSYTDLKNQNMELKDKVRRLKQDRLKLKDKLDNLKRENEALKAEPNFVVSVEEILEDKGKIIIQKLGDNQIFITEYPEHKDIEVGDRLSVSDRMGIIDVINESQKDSRSRTMQIDETPNATFGDIGGLDEKIREVRESTEDAITKTDRFEEIGVEPPSGVLLHGPPGTGKTLIAKAVANSSDATFLKLAGSELVRKFIGEGSMIVRDIFQIAEENEPSIIFIDEIDAIASERTQSKDSANSEVQRTLLQLLSEMDGFEDRDGDIRVIAATNRYDMLDDAILRPGRFDRIIEIPSPDEDGRKQIFEIQTRDMQVDDNVDFNELAEKTVGFTGADIQAVCSESGMRAVRENKDRITQEDFRRAIDKVSESDDKRNSNISGFQ